MSPGSIFIYLMGVVFFYRLIKIVICVVASVAIINTIKQLLEDIAIRREEIGIVQQASSNI